MYGIVNWYNQSRGFGFAKDYYGNQYFIWHSELIEGTKLSPNDIIAFNPLDKPKGLYAGDIRLLGEEEVHTVEFKLKMKTGDIYSSMPRNFPKDLDEDTMNNLGSNWVNKVISRRNLDYESDVEECYMMTK